MTLYMVLRRANGPDDVPNIALVEGKVKARRLAVALNQTSQAGPFFITKAPPMVNHITKETVRRIKRKIGERP